jgi:hypothetical protein
MLQLKLVNLVHLLAPERKTDQIQGREIISKVTYTLRFGQPIDANANASGTVAKVSAYLPNKHKIIYTRVPWL